MSNRLETEELSASSGVLLEFFSLVLMKIRLWSVKMTQKKFTTSGLKMSISKVINNWISFLSLLLHIVSQKCVFISTFIQQQIVPREGFSTCLMCVWNRTLHAGALIGFKSLDFTHSRVIMILWKQQTSIKSQK